MFVLVRRTWLAGADPSDTPDMVKTIARTPSRGVAEARAESLAPGCRENGFSIWRAKAPDALHVFEVARLDGAV